MSIIINSNDKEHFSRRLNIQERELLQVLTEANIKKGFEKKKCSWNSKTQ